MVAIVAIGWLVALWLLVLWFSVYFSKNMS